MGNNKFKIVCSKAQIQPRQAVLMNFQLKKRSNLLQQFSFSRCVKRGGISMMAKPLNRIMKVLFDAFSFGVSQYLCWCDPKTL